MTRILVAQNAPRATHAFLVHAKVVAARLAEYSTYGERWLSAAETVKTDAALEGLAAGAPFGFRHRSVTREGVSDWSEPVTFRPA